MLTAVQIALLCVIGVCLALSLVFMIMFLVEIFKKDHEEEENSEVESVFTINNVTVNQADGENEEVKNESEVDSMLANLDEQTKGEEEPQEEVKEEPVEEEVKEETSEEKPAGVQVIVINNGAPAEEKAEEKEEEVKEEDVDDKADDDLSVSIKELKSVGHETVIQNGSVIDYKERLEKIIQTRDKIDKDLSKIQKSILKYERTKRRMNRNQKMLDRRAGELTNLNLVMYSVTDIKNVDEDKKVKQEELTSHIAELKASIQDAEEFIESNKEKNEHNVKMAKFLLLEKSRYNDEIAEIEELIKKAEGEGATDAE